eukprot:15359509-Ditylum_brightwellii.AAC.1
MLEMYLQRMMLAEEKAFLDKEVSILNLLPPDLVLDEITTKVSAGKMATIEDMVDMPTPKSTKLTMSINTNGLCKAKENILECIANWLYLITHNLVVKEDIHPLLYDAFINLANLILDKDYKTW